MSKHLAKIALVAALAAALPGAGRADDDHHRHGPGCEHGRDVRVGQPLPPLPWNDPLSAEWDRYERDGRLDRDVRAGDVRYDRDGRHDRDGRDGWRARELRELRRDFRELDAKRAAFHQRWAYSPRKLARFDRWYFAERAELERRWSQLQRYYVAWNAPGAYGR